jgi:hypothetical protein
VIPSRYVKGVIARREKNRKKCREFFKNGMPIICKGKNILGNKQAQIHAEMIENLNQNFWS